MYYSIGEFSKITGLTPKMLKIYQEKELLIPVKVDEFTKYRYYNDENLKVANLISFLKQFDFSLASIKEIIDNLDDEGLPLLFEKQKSEILKKITKYEFVIGLINQTINRRSNMTDVNAIKTRPRFWNILAKMVKNAVPLKECLETALQNADPELAAIASTVINDWEAEKYLFQVLSKHQLVFTRIELAIVQAGESVNKLSEALSALGDTLFEVGLPDLENATRSKYWKMYSLALMAGGAIVPSVKLVSDWADKELKQEIDFVCNEMMNGNELFTALSKKPQVFTKYEIELVRIGEVVGILDQTIAYLPELTKMIENADLEFQKRINFWKVLQFFSDRPLSLSINLALMVADEKVNQVANEISIMVKDDKTLAEVLKQYPTVFESYEIRIIEQSTTDCLMQSICDIIEILER